MPGYFDTQWRKANNRIKKLVAVASDQAFTFTFTDKMEEQGKNLSTPLKLTKIKFTIKDVYRSTGDDDTALSEIGFYNAGKKVEIDMSGKKQRERGGLRGQNVRKFNAEVAENAESKIS
jgi:non-ribosomal peptide synthetase component E (peptide arylation enzyme)